MVERSFTAFFPFCGIGGGALGFKRAVVRMLGTDARFEVLGGIDKDAKACADFERLVGAPARCADIATLTPAQLIEFAGAETPDVVFLSPPCKGASGLLSAAKSRTKKYREMNRLTVRWLELMLAAWPTPPALVLLENVPRLKRRAAGMLRRARKLLRTAGYVFADGFHDCGELGGLAQTRRRYLLVARHPTRCPPLLYQPPKRRVRGCGEVLSTLPIPLSPEAERYGRLHQLPKLSWINWVRLALIPAGGDWRDLEGVLRDGQPRREVYRRHKVQRWADPSDTITGDGSNSSANVADPRFGNVDRVTAWDAPTGTVTHAPAPSSGAPAVADPRFPLDACKPGSHHNKYRVEEWDRPAHTVIGADRVGSGAPSVADPRVRGAYDHGYGVLRFDEPSPTVAGGSAVGQGAYAVADPRLHVALCDCGHCASDHGYVGPEIRSECSECSCSRFAPVIDERGFARGSYGVLRYDEPAGTVTGNARATTGTFSVADVRVTCKPRGGAYGVLSWQAAAATITGHTQVDHGRFSVADPRRAPAVIPVIIAADGTWHRPLTTLELAALQGLPTEIDGEPLTLSGSSVSEWRERIGNCVPPPAAEAIATRMLCALVEAAAGGFSLASSSTPVWVREGLEARCE